MIGKNSALALALYLAAGFAATSAWADATPQHFLVVIDFSADNPARDTTYAAHVADMLNRAMAEEGVDFGDRVSLRAAVGSDTMARPTAWTRDVTLSARGVKPGDVAAFLPRLLAEFGSMPTSADSKLAWTIEELGRDISCVQMPTHIYIVTNGHSATQLVGSDLSTDQIVGRPLSGCATLTWIGIGAQGDLDLALRRGLDQLFFNLGQEAGVDDVSVEH